MSGRQSHDVDRALRLVMRGATISQAARQYGLAVSTVRRALRRAGAEPQKPGRRASSRPA